VPKTLYICYFGLREPLVQTQVLPYLREIRKGGIEVSLLTFEPEFRKAWSKAQIIEGRERLATEGITWHCLPYHKRPSVPATVFDILNGTRYVVGMARREKIDVFHVRGHVPAPIGALAKTFCGGKLLFDIRGFMPEEYTDAGVWKESGLIYKTFKWVEKWLMRKSDGFVVLTDAAREILFPEANGSGLDRYGRPVEVIPCCLDFARVKVQGVRETLRRELGWDSKFVLTHVGSLGGLYLTDRVIDLLQVAKRRNPSTAALFLTQSDHAALASKLRAASFRDGDFLIRSVRPDEVFKFLNAADASISIVKESYSSKSRSPTKVAEYLAAGVPVIASPGVGDLDSLLRKEEVGATLTDFSEEGYRSALEIIEELAENPDIRTRCAEVARRNFDLETVGGERYRRLYRSLLNGR
jgi:glycosyltransferase involved in cell wall biosynthesis